MPELGEVEMNRRAWNAGIGQHVSEVLLHPGKRLFRGIPPGELKRSLLRQELRRSEARGKQMLFIFSGDAWLGLHLGMTGELRAEDRSYKPGKHDHLVLVMERCALVFEDMRLFGRVQFALSPEPPSWWRDLPMLVTAREFTLSRMADFLKRRPKLPVKAALLLQNAFPGIGNWMADEILWRSKIHPSLLCGALDPQQQRALWRETRFVAHSALRRIGTGSGDPPKGWLFHERWSKQGMCPVHKTALRRDRIGGRTTAWCPACQAKVKSSRLSKAKSSLTLAAKSSR